MSKQYSFLDLILDNQEHHAKFLNTLSFLEYIGARKIFKGRNETSVDLETLVHMSEEIRHALLFKRLSMKVCSQDRSYNEDGVFCFEVTRRYIGKLDNYCEKLVGKDDCYALVSYVIEQRAVSFYRYYSRQLKKKGEGFTLKSLLLEEERHLLEMEEKIRCNTPQDVVRGALDFEENLFVEFVNALSREIGGDYYPDFSSSSQSEEMPVG